MIRFIDKPIIGLTLALAASCLGCSEDEPTASEATQASAVINPTEGNQAQGTVEFMQEADGVRVIANLTGLTEGDHGFTSTKRAIAARPMAHQRAVTSIPKTKTTAHPMPLNGTSATLATSPPTTLGKPRTTASTPTSN